MASSLQANLRRKRSRLQSWLELVSRELLLFTKIRTWKHFRRSLFLQRLERDQSEVGVKVFLKYVVDIVRTVNRQPELILQAANLLPSFTVGGGRDNQ